MNVLKFVVVFVLGLAALVALVIGAIFAHQGVQLLRFRWSMRSFAKNDADEDDPALQVPKEKGTLEEDKQLVAGVWRLFYRQGLSISKLKAGDRLRTQQAFTQPEWIEWQEWRGWQKLATRGSVAARKKSLAYARREAERRLQRLAAKDVPLWLELYDEKERPEKQLLWAQEHVPGPYQSVAFPLLETLANRKDEVGARSLHRLFRIFALAATRTKALEYAKRHLEHPHGHLEGDIRFNIRNIFTPDIGQLIENGSTWTISAPTDADLVVQVHALDVKAAETVWLDNPGAPLEHAKLGALLWEHELPRPGWSLFSNTNRKFRLPNLEGPVQIKVVARYACPELWAACMGQEELPTQVESRRLSNTTMDAVLSMTENSASVWLVDKKTKAPLANNSLTAIVRDATGKLETETSTTDEKGHFTKKGSALWQFGVLFERENAQGRQEQLFVTNGTSITTSKAPTPLRRFYVFLARPLYRPGETVRGKLIAREKGAEGPSQRLPPSLVFDLDVFTPRGTKLTTISCTLSEFGTASFELQVPPEAPLGKYTFRVSKSNSGVEGSFQVEEFVAPEFKAELRAKNKLRWGRAGKLEFEATYFFGGPVTNASGTLDIKRANWHYRHDDSGSYSKWFRAPKHIASVLFKTDAKGRAEIDLPWKGPFNLFRRYDGCDVSFVATVRDASGKSCQANLHLSIPRLETIISVQPIRALRLPGETLPLRLSWEPADPTDESARELTLVCRRGWSKKTFVHQVRRADATFDLPIELSPGKWKVSAHVEGQTSRLRMKSPFTLLGPDLAQKQREMILSNDPSDNQGTIRVALTGPKTFGGYDLLVWNRGARLGSRVIPRSGPTSWIDLPYMPGTEREVYLAWWYFDTREDGLFRDSGRASVDPVDLPNEPPTDLSLGFPSATVRPGEQTSLEAKLGVAPAKPSELTVTVVDEAIFSLVAPPKSPKTFFEDSPPRPESYAAWSVLSAAAQRGREVESRRPSNGRQGVSYGGPVLDEVCDLPMMQSRSMPMPGAPPPMMAMAAPAPKSASPMRAAAALAVAPVALVAGGAELAAGALRRRSEEAAKEDALEQQEAGAMANEAPVQLRNDFSSEAAWIPNSRWVRGTSLTVPISLPDSLTTWKATAVLVSLAHDHLLEAHARVRAQKPLMVRLQAPRFFQERDVSALRAMVDSRADQELSIRTTLEAKGFVLPDKAKSSQKLEPNGQARIDVEITVPVCQTPEVVVRAESRATNVDDASDAEERRIPYRPYGTLLRKTFSGVLDDDRIAVDFELPAERLKELTNLAVQLDRGPLDAVLTALSFLREYPYGCVEQTCSRLLPHLVWERLAGRNQSESGAYRQASKIPDDVVQETLKRIASMQNGDGGFGWWPGAKSDLWMTAYVVFTFVLAKQPQTSSIGSARSYLTNHLLKRDHSDDADAFATFVLVWTGASSAVSDRVIEVLASRWENLSLTEQAKLWWVLAECGHESAREKTQEVFKALVGPAKRFLKKVAKEKDEHELQWFHPGSTEAIAFFVLSLVRERQAEPDLFEKRFVDGEASLKVLVSFLLQHRQGRRWHNTRDTALAVMALLAYEEAVQGTGPERTVDLQINAETKRTVKLGALDVDPVAMKFADDDLRVGKNEMTFVLTQAPSQAMALPRHFSAELRYYTQEAEIKATGEGILVERTYWLLDEKKEPKKRLRSGDKIVVGDFVRVEFKIKAAKERKYLLLEDFKLAGCEPVEKTSGRKVCRGHCAHVELRADRTAIFFDAVGTDEHEVSYDIEAVLPGRFTAVPAKIETMYEAKCYATSASFGVTVGER